MSSSSFAPDAGEGPFDLFARDLAAVRTVHAYLVTGPAGSGKRAFAQWAAGALLCAHSTGGQACGHCPACARAEKGTHPDLIEVYPSKASMSVDDVRQMLLDLSNRPYEGGRRAVLVRQAHKMTPQAQNALLKTLEEPDAHTTFFLLCEDASVMLQTIKSRCRTVRMRPDPQLTGKLIAAGVEQTMAAELALFSGGAYARALEARNDAATLAAREAACRIVALRAPHEVPALWSSIKEEKETAPLILQWLEVYFSDMLRAACGAKDTSPDSAQKAERFTIAQIQAIINRIIRTSRMLSANVSWQNAVEPLLYTVAGDDGPFTQ